MEIIKQDIADQIKNSQKTKNRLLYEFDITINTLNRWIDQNNMGLATLLTTPMGLKAIAEELELKKSELLTEV